MAVSETGIGLHIVVPCEGRPSDAWLSFASWYAARYNLPDAGFTLACDAYVEANILAWARKLSVPCRRPARLGVADPLVLPLSVIAVRPYDPACVGPTAARSDVPSTFVDCGECGSFVLAEWIDKRPGPPFVGAARRFGPANPNEARVFSLWERCQAVYSAM